MKSRCKEQWIARNRAVRIGACGLLVVGSAAAQSNSTERAAAETLFQQATLLMADKQQQAKACEKFEASQQLDRALGTTLRLADCYDKTSRTASAWSMFKEAASVARARNEPDRVRIATERAADLEKRLSKLQLRVDPKNDAALVLRVNGAVIPRALWDAPIPVDPGRQQIEASAPERTGWSSTTDVSPGPALEIVDVPALAPKPGAAVSASGSPSPMAPDTAARGGTQRAIGYGVGALALAGFAGGGLLAYRANRLNHESLDLCRPDEPQACSAEGLERRNDALGFAQSATIVLAASGVLFVGSIVLVVSAPRSETHRTIALGLSPQVAPQGAGLNLQGAW